MVPYIAICDHIMNVIFLNVTRVTRLLFVAIEPDGNDDYVLFKSPGRLL